MSNIIRADTVPGLDRDLLVACLVTWLDVAAHDPEIPGSEIREVKKIHDFLRRDGVLLDPAQLATCLDDWLEADREREEDGEYEDDPDFDPELRGRVEAQCTVLRSFQ